MTQWSPLVGVFRNSDVGVAPGVGFRGSEGMIVCDWGSYGWYFKEGFPLLSGWWCEEREFLRDCLLEGWMRGGGLEQREDIHEIFK